MQLVLQLVATDRLPESPLPRSLAPSVPLASPSLPCSLPLPFPACPTVPPPHLSTNFVGRSIDPRTIANRTTQEEEVMS